MAKILWIAFTLFLLMDSIGNIPLYIALLKEIPPKKQVKIVIRELVFALFIIIFFNFVGEATLKFLHVSRDTVQVAGGVILFLIAIKMIFPIPKTAPSDIEEIQEPFIVPLAVPLVAGPAVLTSVMLFTTQVSNLVMVSAIILAWIPSLIILTLSPYIARKLGIRGIIACQRLMGLILVLLAVEMFLTGIAEFIETLPLNIYHK